MPARTQNAAAKNIWVAAGDGDLARVQVRTYLIFTYRLNKTDIEPAGID